MEGNYLSKIVLFDAWQDAGGRAATAPLIRLSGAKLQGEEMKEKEGGERLRDKGRRVSQMTSRKDTREGAIKKRGRLFL